MLNRAHLFPARRASAADTARTVLNVLAPTVAQGMVARRPAVLGLADTLDADRRAIRQMQRLKARYGPGPVQLSLAGRTVAIVLSPGDVHRVLDGSPEPFTLANREKRAALGRFGPHNVLISHGRRRAERREFNERVLDTGQAVHRLADAIVPRVRDEAHRLATAAAATGQLSWDGFIIAWWRMVRRVVLGDAARNDHQTSDLLTRLRHDANWSYLLPARRYSTYERFQRRLRGHLARGQPGSLAGLVAEMPSSPEIEPADQVPQWLFAFDAAGMVTIRALALLAAHPEHTEQVRDKFAETCSQGRSVVAGVDLSRPQQLRNLRAAVLESARLWPTTPAVLRDTTTDTTWQAGTVPAGSAVLIYTPFFHRDDQELPYADRFAPEIWVDEAGHGDWPLIPFSEGPGVCPGQNLVLLTASTFLAALLEHHRYPLQHRLDPQLPLPASLSPYHLRFSAEPAS